MNKMAKMAMLFVALAAMFSCLSFLAMQTSLPKLLPQSLFPSSALNVAA
jgi:hypothetical protein